MVTPPDAVPLAFGDDSFLPHLDAARRLGIEPMITALPGIGLDIDTAQDLALLMQSSLPTHSRAFLAAQEPAALLKRGPAASSNFHHDCR
jgi:2-phospho-L-lactate guanylyltransferase